MLRACARSVSKTIVAEILFISQAQHLCNCMLYYPVNNYWYAQWSFLSRGALECGSFLPAWLYMFLSGLVPIFFSVLRKVSFNLGICHFIYAWGTFVFGYSVDCVRYIVRPQYPLHTLILHWLASSHFSHYVHLPSGSSTTYCIRSVICASASLPSATPGHELRLVGITHT